VGGSGTVVGGSGTVIGGSGTVIGGSGTVIGGSGTIISAGNGGSAGSNPGSDSGCSCSVPNSRSNRNALLVLSLAACAGTLRQWRRKSGKRITRR
jgi:MYXO-CTERM domain-containing protein